MNLFVLRSFNALAGLLIASGATCLPASAIEPVRLPPYPRGVAEMNQLGTSCFGGAAIARLDTIPGLDHRAITLRAERAYAAATVNFPTFYLSPVPFEKLS